MTVEKDLELWGALVYEPDLMKRAALLNDAIRGLDAEDAAHALAQILNAGVDSFRILRDATGRLIPGTEDEIETAIKAAVERVSQEQVDSQFRRMTDEEAV